MTWLRPLKNRFNEKQHINETVLLNVRNDTVNSEIFVRVLYSRNFAYAKFRENKIVAEWRNHSVVY